MTGISKSTRPAAAKELDRLQIINNRPLAASFRGRMKFLRLSIRTSWPRIASTLPALFAATWANVGTCLSPSGSPGRPSGRSALTVRSSRRLAGVFWVGGCCGFPVAPCCPLRLARPGPRSLSRFGPLLPLSPFCEVGRRQDRRNGPKTRTKRRNQDEGRKARTDHRTAGGPSRPDGWDGGEEKHTKRTPPPSHDRRTSEGGESRARGRRERGRRPRARGPADRRPRSLTWRREWPGGKGNQLPGGSTGRCGAVGGPRLEKRHL